VKSIRDFVTSKVRRSEIEDRVRVEISGAADPELGEWQACLRSEVEAIRFYEHGLIDEGDHRIRYDEIRRVELAPSTGDTRELDVISDAGWTLRLSGSDDGMATVHATLRWIGNALLRRRIAD